ncbi:radical SAM protein [bacterium]|nr:radical SAM protein [bacterium]
MRRLFDPIRRAAWRGYMNTAARLHELKLVSWEATNRCNLACLHCANQSGPQADTVGELSTGEVIALFESIAADFDAKQVGVSVGGGEPLLRPDLFTITARLSELGFSWSMVTNGMRLDRRALAQCIETGISAFSFSLDGLPRHHERLRGKGTFQPAAAAIERVLAAEWGGVVEASTILARGVADELDAIYRQMQNLGVQRWRLLPLAAVGRAAEHPELALTGPELRRALDWLLAQRATGGSPEVTFDESGYLGEPYEERVRGGKFMCSAGINTAQVCWDGAVTGCAFIGRGFAQGNVRERRFSEIWEDGFRELRDRRWTRQGQCAACKSYADCRGGCLLQWGSPQGTGPACCWARLLEDSDE